MNSYENLSSHSKLFHYNPYTKKWACFEREDLRNYFNGTSSINKIGKGNDPEQAYMNQAETIQK